MLIISQDAWTHLQDDGSDSQNQQDVNEGMGQTHRAKLMNDASVRDYTGEENFRGGGRGGRGGRGDHGGRGGGYAGRVTGRGGGGRANGYLSRSIFKFLRLVSLISDTESVGSHFFSLPHVSAFREGIILPLNPTFLAANQYPY